MIIMVERLDDFKENEKVKNDKPTKDNPNALVDRIIKPTINVDDVVRDLLKNMK